MEHELAHTHYHTHLSHTQTELLAQRTRAHTDMHAQMRPLPSPPNIHRLTHIDERARMHAHKHTHTYTHKADPSCGCLGPQLLIF